MEVLIIFPLPETFAKKLEGPFYVVETFPYPLFVTDEEGDTKTFDSYEAAATEASDCQQGYVLTFE
jgi:hypothetical protein